MSEPEPLNPLRREPPTFMPLEVRSRRSLGDRMMRVTIGGADLAGFEAPDPGGSVRLLLPEPDTDGIEIPTWNGNEFLRLDGTRPTIRTLTPRYHRPDLDEIDVDVVIHGATPLAGWATTAEVGSAVALSGPGRGFAIDERIRDILLVGDESALPAIGQLLEALPAAVAVAALVEVAEAAGRIELPEHPGAEITWLEAKTGAAPGSAMVDAVRATDLGPETHLWVAGEAAAVQAIRQDVLRGRGVERYRATIRGYWKRDRRGT